MVHRLRRNNPEQNHPRIEKHHAFQQPIQDSTKNGAYEEATGKKRYNRESTRGEDTATNHSRDPSLL